MKKLLLLSLLGLPLLSMKVDAPSDTVYICTGPKAKVYHSTSKCRGLNRCSGDIKSISLKEAKKSRRACKICYK